MVDSSAHYKDSAHLNPFIHARILSNSRHFVMDSLPQELIDAIIDNVPQPSLPSCSLVAKRWRQKSQQRVLGTISFSSEHEVKRWCTDIPRDSESPFSYFFPYRVGKYGITKYLLSWFLRYHTLVVRPKGVGNKISIYKGCYINV